MTRAVTSVGPLDNGRRMSLDEFDTAEGREGFLYELGRGTIVVVDVPDRKHLAQVDNARQQLSVYRATNRGKIYRIAGGAECKILLADLESERHPDIAVYREPPPDDQNLWSRWVPEIVIEVISPGSEERDYVEKRDEYLKFGVREYWILDYEKRQMLVLRRSGGRWIEKIVRSGETYRTRLLTGLEFAPAPIFEAAANA